MSIQVKVELIKAEEASKTMQRIRKSWPNPEFSPPDIRQEYANAQHAFINSGQRVLELLEARNK